MRGFWSNFGRSVPSRAPDPRAVAVKHFLEEAGWGEAERAPLSGDASSRSYERLSHPTLGPAVLMNAPPEEGVGPAPFAAATGTLRARGLSAPEIYAADLDEGFLLLEDLGDALYARVAASDPDQEITLYGAAGEALAALHAEAAPEMLSGYGAEIPLAPYDEAVLLREARLLLDWTLPALTDVAPSSEAEQSFIDACRTLVQSVSDARSALVLRDYHAENLIWLPDRTGVARVGQLDYQDALAGHPAYDIVSLIEDARRDVSPDAAEAVLTSYCAASGADRAEIEASMGGNRRAHLGDDLCLLRIRPVGANAAKQDSRLAVERRGRVFLDKEGMHELRRGAGDVAVNTGNVSGNFRLGGIGNRAFGSVAQI